MGGIRSCIWFFAAGLSQLQAEITFRPSAITSPHGAVSEIELWTEPLELEPGSLAHHLHGTKIIRLSEPAWLIAYKTEVVDGAGKPVRENYVCHTFFGDQKVDQREDKEMTGIYSDHVTHELRLPEGFGIRLEADQNLHWMPMFNNRGDSEVRVRMRAVLAVIRDKDLKKPLRRLLSSLRSVAVPHLYFVPPGEHARSTTFETSFDGRIHVIGAHVHPYVASIELVNSSQGEKVWRAEARTSSKGETEGIDSFSSVAGYPVRAGERYTITAVYKNPTRDQIDAMAGLFILYSRN